MFGESIDRQLFRDSGGGGAHFGNGGRGTKDNPASYPAGFEEACTPSTVNATNNGCTSYADCRNNDGLPTVAGQSYFHSIWATEFGASGGDKGCRDGDGFVAGSYGPKVLTAGHGGGRIVLAAVNPGMTGSLVMNGIVRTDGNRGCGHGNDSAGGGAGGSVLLVGDVVTIGPTAVVSAKGGRGGDEQPKCNACTLNSDCQGGQTCTGGRCGPCNCKPCATNANCASTQTCVNLGGALGKVCVNASNQCDAFDPSDNEDECIGNQNSGTCDDCGGGGGGGIINVMSRTRTIDVAASFNISGAVGGICPVCTGEAGGGAGELLIDGAYIGEVCDGYDNDFNGTPDDIVATVSCGTGSCAMSQSACTAGSPPLCDPGNGNASCLGSRGTSRPRIALLLDSSASMLQNLSGVVTFGDGSGEHPGIDTNSDTLPNDSKLYLAKDAVSQLIAAYPEIDFALSRYHQDEGFQRSCQTAKWLDCQSVCCSYDNPNNGITTSPVACALNLPKTPSGTIPLTVYEDSTKISRCINYAGTCGAPRRGADILVGFDSDVRQYMSWVDGGETNFLGDTTIGDFCRGGDCELRGSGPTPIAESLRALYDYVTPIKKIDPAAACRDYSVIFVSDGGEECGGNPVAAAAELWTKGIKTYVIGVSVDTNQAATLNAIAAAGQTTSFIPVTNSTQLLPALVSIVSGSIRTELCNGIDDNCNGVIDEGFNVGATCDNGQKGICLGTGHIDCDPADARKTVCKIDVPGQAPKPSEICNQLDDNCNGLIDEGNPGGGGACGSSTGSCKPGHLECQGGTLNCIGASTGKPEVCNGVDDDCNGTTDDCGGVAGGCNGGACGSSIGECQPGMWMCQGASGYVCIGGSLPQAEVCNGKDDDCNGAIDDNVPGTGVPCDSLADGTMLCKPGTVRCLGGKIVCQGGIAFHPPTCACPADDCGIPTDGGVQTDGCPSGSACIGCACRTPCAAGEFPCSGDSVCRNGFCVPPACGGRLCTSWEDCINDMCVDRCTSITCLAGIVCSKGACVDNSCYGLGCPTGQVCRDSSCVADPCANVTCNGDQFCRDGTCVDSCQAVFCATGTTCEDGTCVATGCTLPCAAGLVCSGGLCVDDPCVGKTCAVGHVCELGTCVDDPCNDVKCPGDPALVHCVAGQCVPYTAVPAPKDPEKIVGAGSGGFSCEVTAVGVSAGNAPLPFALCLLLVALRVRQRRRSAGMVSR